MVENSSHFSLNTEWHSSTATDDLFNFNHSGFHTQSISLANYFSATQQSQVKPASPAYYSVVHYGHYVMVVSLLIIIPLKQFFTAGNLVSNKVAAVSGDFGFSEFFDVNASGGGQFFLPRPEVFSSVDLVRVFDTISDAIISGRFTSGTELTEITIPVTALSSGFDISIESESADTTEAPPVKSVLDFPVPVFAGSTNAAIESNVVPVADSDSVSIVADNFSISGDVLSNDSDANDDALVVTSMNGVASSQPLLGQYGQLLWNSTGTYQYLIDSNNVVVQQLIDGQSLVESFTYIVSDGAGGSSTAQLVVTILGTNDDPVVNVDVNNITEDAVSAVQGNLLINDSDIDEQAVLSVSEIDGINDALTDVMGNFGTLDWANDGGYSYQIDNGNSAVQSLAVGDSLVETFTYTVTDGEGGSGSATLSITITGTNDLPIISGDTSGLAIESGVSSGSDAQGDVVINDVDAGESFFSAGVYSGVYGELTLNANGQWSYSIDNDDPVVNALAISDSLTDTLTISSVDGSQQQINITVQGANDSPLAMDDQGFAVNEDATVNIDAATLLANDSDVDQGASLRFTGADAGNGDLAFIYNMATVGQATIDTNTSTVNLTSSFTNPVVFAFVTSENSSEAVIARVSHVTNQSFDVSLVEPAGYDGVHGSETISYMVFEAGIWELADGTRLEIGTESTNNIINGSSDLSTLTFDQSFTNAPTVFTQVQTQNNNTDFLKTRQDDATVDNVQFGLEQYESVTADLPFSEQVGYLAIESSGSGSWDGFSYVVGSTADAVTQNNFVINFAQSVGGTPNMIGQLATFDGGDDAALRGSSLSGGQAIVSVEEDISRDGETSHTTEVANFLAIGGNNIVLTAHLIAASAPIATEQLVGIQYNPNHAFDFLSLGETAVDTLTYTVSDEYGATDQGIISVTVTGTIDTPFQIIADTFQLNEDGTVNFSISELLSNDGDPDTPAAPDPTLVSTIPVGSLGVGVITDLGNGNYRYTPTAELAGSDSFDYTITDGVINYTASVTFNTIAQADTPTLSVTASAADAVSMPDSELVFHFNARDTSADGLGVSPDLTDQQNLSTWFDVSGNNNNGSAAGTNPQFDAQAMNNQGGISFAGAQHLIVGNNADINTSTYNTKTFAVAFQTGSNVTNEQVIFEQGGTVRGYSISIADGRAYAFVFNNSEWAASDQYKVIDLGAVEANQEYSIIMIHDALSGTGTFTGYFNGELIQTLDHVDFQRAHGGAIGIGGVAGNILSAVDQTAITSNIFLGSVAELVSWNSALSASEVRAVSYNFAQLWNDNDLLASQGVSHFINFDIMAETSDVDGSETLTVMIDDVPDGIMFTAGAQTDHGDGTSTWTLADSDLSGLQLGFDPDVITGPINLNVTAVTVEASNSDSAQSQTHVVINPNALLEDMGEDTLVGTSDNDTLIGGLSDDLFIGSAEADVILGGEGEDTVSYATSSAAVDVNLALATASGGDADGDVLSTIENLVGSANADTLVGDGNANTIQGLMGADQLIGGLGVDTVSYSASDMGVTINLTTNSADGGHATGDTLTGFENITGSSFDDQLTGDSGDNELAGGAGNDALVGHEGSDVFLFAEADGVDTVSGGLAGGWTDIINLSHLSQGPGASIVGPGDWVLVTSDTYTINGSNKTLTFDNGDGSGTIQMNGGNEISFLDIEAIKWL